MTNKIKILGIGSNSLEQLNTSSFLVKTEGDEWCLVDCGADIPRQVSRVGVGFTQITSLILTHRHLDHTLGVPYFLFGRNLERLAKTKEDPSYVAPNLKVFAEQEVWDSLLSLFTHFHPDVKELGYGFSFIELRSNTNSKMALSQSKSILFISVNHAVPTFGLVIFEGPTSILAYSSDTLPCPAFESAAAGVRLLIHEAMVPSTEGKFSATAKHATAQQAGEAARRIAPEKALMIHLRPAFLPQRAALESEASIAAGQDMRYPQEGNEIDF